MVDNYIKKIFNKCQEKNIIDDGDLLSVHNLIEIKSESYICETNIDK